MSNATYTPSRDRVRHGDYTCIHCGCPGYVHHTDRRCYTPDERAARLRAFQRTGRWPGADDDVSEPGGPC
jgi:hypothetical protein